MNPLRLNPRLAQLQTYPFDKLRTPLDDAEFARRLQRDYNVLSGRNHIRIALVAPIEECVEAIRRLMQFAKTL